MKKEFINPTMRFSFFNRENIVTDSTNAGDANAALNGAAGEGKTVSIKTVTIGEIKGTL
ncbi:MAG: hypothetical protein Q4G33_05455 [bacterium]|nr:hypothetical protein [bacterium]